MARTYRAGFKKLEEEDRRYFVKSNFEFHAYCGSRYENSEQNILLRMDKALMKAINMRVRLPKFIIVVPDDDIITFAKFEGQGAANLLGKYLDSLINNVQRIVEARHEQLPSKAMKVDYPIVYWVAAPKHVNFGVLENDLRVKFNLCMESIVKQKELMRVIKIKEIWQQDDVNLVNQDGVFTLDGAIDYWAGVDAAIKYNATKWEECRI